MSYYRENQMIRHFPNLQELHQGMKFAVILFLAASSCVSSLAHNQAHQKGVGQLAEVGSVCVFMDTGCPIARYHTRTLRLLHEEYAGKGIRFAAVFPAANTTEKSLQAYVEKYKFPLKAILDPGQARARALKATIVPEVFVFDRNEKLIYRGRIDDRFAAVGKRRPLTRTHDLADVLRALSASETIEPRKTKAIGCAITFRQKDTSRE